LHEGGQNGGEKIIVGLTHKFAGVLKNISPNMPRDFAEL
jgi:hypothetical protein